MIKNKSYLITGGFGLIGSTLANSLKGDITILSRSTTHQDRITNPNIKVLIKNLNTISPDDLKNINIIYHCASTVDNYNVLTDPYIDTETNINGTVRLLEACKALHKKPKIIFPSTFFVYGNEYDLTHKPINEESKTNPLALYPATKLCAESIIKLYSRLYGISYIICRLTNVYGEQEEFTNKKKGALNFMIMQAIKGEPLTVYNGGKFYRDYIYVTDVVNALQFLENKNISNDTFLVGYGEPILFQEIINYIHTLTNNKSKIEDINPPSFHSVVGIKNFVADISKIRGLGWSPRVLYIEGIKRIVDRYISILSVKH